MEGIAEMKDDFYESSLSTCGNGSNKKIVIPVTSRLVLDQQLFYFTQPDTTPAKLVQDIIGRLS